jgi:hypothetical protein
LASDPGGPDVDGIHDTVEVSQLLTVELVEGAAERLVDDGVKGACLLLEAVELLFDRGAVGPYIANLGGGLVDGGGGVAVGGVAVPEPGVDGCVVGVPHRWTQLVV